MPAQHRTIVIGQLAPATAAAFLATLEPEARADQLVAFSRVRMVAEQDALDVLRSFLAFFGSPEDTHFELGGRSWLRTVIHEADPAGPLLCQAAEDAVAPGRMPVPDSFAAMRPLDTRLAAGCMGAGRSSMQQRPLTAGPWARIVPRVPTGDGSPSLPSTLPRNAMTASLRHQAL